MMKRTFSAAAILVLAVSTYIVIAADTDDITLTLDTADLAPGTAVKLNVQAAYEVLTNANRVRAVGQAGEVHTIELVAPAPQLQGKKLTFRLPHGLVKPAAGESSAVVITTEFEMRLPDATNTVSGSSELSVPWEPGNGPIARRLELESVDGKPFRIRLLPQ